MLLVLITLPALVAAYLILANVMNVDNSVFVHLIEADFNLIFLLLNVIGYVHLVVNWVRGKSIKGLKLPILIFSQSLVSLCLIAHEGGLSVLLALSPTCLIMVAVLMWHVQSKKLCGMTNET